MAVTRSENNRVIQQVIHTVEGPDGMPLSAIVEDNTVIFNALGGTIMISATELTAYAELVSAVALEHAQTAPELP